MKTIYATELGKPAKVSANKKYRAYKTPYGYEVYSVSREMIFTETDIKYGRKLEAIHVFNISDLENLEWGIETHNAQMRAELKEEFGV